MFDIQYGIVCIRMSSFKLLAIYADSARRAYMAPLYEQLPMPLSATNYMHIVLGVPI